MTDADFAEYDCQVGRSKSNVGYKSRGRRDGGVRRRRRTEETVADVGAGSSCDSS